MSYILDALKKIEREKNKKARPVGRFSISGDLFQERERPAATTAIWKVLVIISLASLVTFAGTWFVLHGNSTERTAVIRPVAAPPSAPVSSAAVTPAIPVPVQSQVTSAAVLPAASPAAVTAVPKSTVTVADGDSPRQKVRRSKKRARVQPPSPIVPAQTVQAPADIKLSGIAWQDERRARRAVVNGFLLKEGAVVSGAKISEIQADKVRFSSAAGIFEIRLDAVLPAGAQR